MLPEASSTLVGGVGGAFDRAPVGSGHVGGFISLFADDNVKLDEFAVSDATDGLLRVVPDDGGLEPALLNFFSSSFILWRNT
jgi:hypothetical protein